MRYGSDAQEMLLQSASLARKMGHSYVGSAHFLLTLLDLQELPGR